MPPRGSQQLFGVKISSKMKSASSNYSDDKFSAKSNNFLKITIFRGFIKIWGVKMTPRGSQQLFGVKITSKMKSAPSNYSECKFQQNPTTFKKSLYQGKVFFTFFGSKMPPRWANQNFPGIYTMVFAKETIQVVSVPKVKKLQRRLEDIGSKVHFQPKRFFWVQKPPWGVKKNF